MHCCYCTIIPPHILDHLSENPDPRVRSAGRSTQVTTQGFRVQRELMMGMTRAASSTGQLRRTVYDAKQTPTLPGTLVRAEGAPPTRDAATDEAYDAAGDTHAFFLKVFSRNSIDGKGMRLDSTVHYREDPQEGFDNAFWNGEQMVYGDGDGVLFTRFTRSLDVIGHELTHGVTQYEAGLEYHQQPGALNESMSDVFGTMVKQYRKNQTVASADWLIGAELLVAPGQALRSMKAPGTAYDNPSLGKDPQPDRMSRYVQLPDTRRGDNGGVHINSGIPNRAFYLACVNLGAARSWEKAGQVWYATLCNRLGPNASFADAAQATTAVAQEQLGADAAKAVRAAWEEVEVLPRAPVVVVPGGKKKPAKKPKPKKPAVKARGAR